jgi:hypothetical protein
VTACFFFMFRVWYNETCHTHSPGSLLLPSSVSAYLASYARIHSIEKPLQEIPGLADDASH